MRLLVRLLEQEELELRAEHRVEPELGGPLELSLQDLARRGGDRGAVVPRDVAEYERRPFQPGNPAQRAEIGNEPEVAVAPLPARDLVPRDRIHLHLEREQVVAALD